MILDDDPIGDILAQEEPPVMTRGLGSTETVLVDGDTGEELRVTEWDADMGEYNPTRIVRYRPNANRDINHPDYKTPLEIEDMYYVARGKKFDRHRKTMTYHHTHTNPPVLYKMM